mmetsp:Transcript_7719/g.22031  ORF Transcript_7719/g.22031 Transcript_7719/m.22031 type:complete len:219 (+) Transcript_7719:330-986(+)
MRQGWPAEHQVRGRLPPEGAGEFPFHQASGALRLQPGHPALSLAGRLGDHLLRRGAGDLPGAQESQAAGGEGAAGVPPCASSGSEPGELRGYRKTAGQASVSGEQAQHVDLGKYGALLLELFSSGERARPRVQGHGVRQRFGRDFEAARRRCGGRPNQGRARGVQPERGVLPPEGLCGGLAPFRSSGPGRGRGPRGRHGGLAVLRESSEPLGGRKGNL